MSTYSPQSFSIGRVQLSSPANPGAGAALVITVPFGRVWRPRAIGFALTTSATVATRTPIVTAQDAATFVYARSVQQNGLTASLASAMFFQLGDTTAPGSLIQFVAGMFDVYMTFGHRFVVSAVNLQAGDTITDTRFHYEEWLV